MIEMHSVERTRRVEAIDMLPVTPTFLVTSRTTHFDQLLQQRSVEAYLALIYPKY